MLRDAPIKKKIKRVILLTSGTVLIITLSAYLVYEFITFRQQMVLQLSVQAKIIASNSTAALAFNSPEDAYEILAALKAEPHIVVAALYDKDGALFAFYPQQYPTDRLPKKPFFEHHRFVNSQLILSEPVIQHESVLGVLYLNSDMQAMYSRLMLYILIAGIVIVVSATVAYFLSDHLQGNISQPILALAETAKAISERKDYSVRVPKAQIYEIGILTDAFNQMLAEIHTQSDQIQSFNKQLEQTIEKRTHDLEVANKELEAFSYSVSDDLRAPLRSINGFSQIMIEDYGHILDEQGNRTLKTIIKNGERMGRLIDDLLAFSKLGKQSITKSTLDMDALAHAVVEDLQGQYTKNAEIKINPLPSVKGDSSMLKQVMENLVSNALKYSMKKDKALVEIGSYRENGCQIYFVKDNGAGFNMLYYDKLFGVFQRLHSANEFEGTGVGLALVNRIIKKHEGKVWAEGKENEGATFYFSLPTV